MGTKKENPFFRQFSMPSSLTTWLRLQKSSLAWNWPEATIVEVPSSLCYKQCLSSNAFGWTLLRVAFWILFLGCRKFRRSNFRSGHGSMESRVMSTQRKRKAKETWRSKCFRTAMGLWCPSTRESPWMDIMGKPYKYIDIYIYTNIYVDK